MFVRSDKSHIVYDEINVPKGNRLKKGRSWMAQAEETICIVTNMCTIDQGEVWVIVPKKLSYMLK
jgi:hypothetical protein